MLFFSIIAVFNSKKITLFFKFFKKKIKNEINFLIFLKKKGLIFRKGRDFYRPFKNTIFKNKIAFKQLVQQRVGIVTSHSHLINNVKSKPYSKASKISRVNKSFFEVLDHRQKVKKQKRKRPDIKKINFKSNFSYRKKENSTFLKSFFLKKKVLKKKIDSFFKKWSGKNNYYTNFFCLLFMSLIRSKLVKFMLDCKFFIKKGLIFVNSTVIRDPFFVLKVGDRVQIPFFKKYYIFLRSNRAFLKKKIKKMKKRYFRLVSVDKPLKSFFSWDPSFLKKFVFYNIDIPSNLEVDFFMLTIIVIKKEKHNLKKNIYISKIMSIFLSKSYNWKRIS